MSEKEFQRKDVMEVDLQKVFAAVWQKSWPKVNVKVDNLLREFILGGGFEIEMPE